MLPFCLLHLPQMVQQSLVIILSNTHLSYGICFCPSFSMFKSPSMSLKVQLNLPVHIKPSPLKIPCQWTEQVLSDEFYLFPIIKGARLGSKTFSDGLSITQWWFVLINFHRYC